MTPWAYACYAVLVAGCLFWVFLLVKRRERNKWRMRQIEEDAQTGGRAEPDEIPLLYQRQP